MGSKRWPPRNAPWKTYKVSKYFTAGEFWPHQSELPTAAQVHRASVFAKKYLDPLRRVYGPGYIISADRSIDHNREVGGAPNSYHVRAYHPLQTAVDVVFAKGAPGDWYRTASELTPGGLGKYPTHIHIDDRAQRARW